jgi:parallel beta-helix repeat protein
MIRKVLLKKTFVMTITVLFTGVGIIPSLDGAVVEKKTNPTISNGNTLYVGGSGLGNYTKIQDAINSSKDGDTVFVYDESSPYFENVYVSKSINLVGEDKSTTVIDGGENGDVVYISPQWVNLSGFTIQKSGTKQFDAGIDITSSYNTITDNNISNNRYGILIYGSWCNSNIIMGNNISDNWYGIESDGYSNIIQKNNFLDNYKNAFFSIRKILKRNLWRQNYWNKPQLLPKFIFGEIIITLDVSPPWDYIEIQWFAIDWCPAKEPYYI